MDSEAVVVVTGASRGLGAGIVRRARERGLRVASCARSLAPEKGPELLARRVDVTDADAVDAFAEAVFAHFGRADLWINNAGVLEPIAALRDVSAEAFRAHVDVNLTGVFLGTRAYVRALRARGARGALVNVSSGAARKPYEGWGPYCAAKAAVDRLTEVVALEERERLRAWSVAPGVIDTDMQAAIRASDPAAFPERPRFEAMKRDGAFSSAAFVADRLFALALEPGGGSDEVCVRLPPEGGD